MKNYELICHTNDTRELTIGKRYYAVETCHRHDGFTFYILNDLNQTDYYSDKKGHNWYYGYWFNSERELRKKKLERLGEVVFNQTEV